MITLRKVLNLPDSPAKPAPESPVEPPGWVWEPEGRGTRSLRVLGRFLLFGTAAVLMLLGLRSLAVPMRAAAPAAAASVSFPGDATAVASRFAMVYLTTDGEAEQRSAALGLDVAPGAAVVTDWHGDRTSRADTVFPAQLHVADGGSSAWATVVAHVATKPASTTPKATPVVQWVALSVPLQAIGGRAVVSGTPAFVSLPLPGRLGSLVQPSATDEPLTRQTRDGAQAFFKAFGSDDAAAVEQATAPGADIQPLGTDITLKSLDAWTVSQGWAPTRTAHAVVTWSVGGGATVQQAYQVGLISTSAGSTQAWRVQKVVAELFTQQEVSP
ncbi:conjugal transfer protein [Nostocoides vanveenii]|uniref:conjugal transfer protein n=1 Tax=Nostocoides vanveenii TaxID=330835 RepID=UPI0031E44197